MFKVVHEYVPGGETRVFKFADGARTLTLISGKAKGYEIGVSLIIPVDGEFELTADSEVMVAVMKVGS